jgi:hypothetical protein
MSTTNPDSETTRAPGALRAPETVHTDRGREAAKVAPRPELAGYRLVYPGQSDVYLVDPAGFRRRIPNRATYCRLFRDERGIVCTRELVEIAQRPGLATGTLLLTSDSADSIYLLDDGRKRLVTSRQVMDKYWFNLDRVSLVRKVLVDVLPAGEIWE